MTTVWFSILILVIGFFMLMFGSNYFVEGASSLATRLKIPEIYIGLTLVAMGTSMPEAAVSIFAGIKNQPEIAFGNVIGSNIFNVLCILGISACIFPICVRKNTYKKEIPFLICITILLIPMMMNGILSRMEAIILSLLFIIYIMYIIISSMDQELAMLTSTITLPWWKRSLFIIGGLSAIILGSQFAVYGATNIATAFGISQRLIGLTIVSIGTSLPELFTSVTASIKKNNDLAIGNIVGSNIFNILFILGATSIIRPITIKTAFFVDVCIAIVTTMLFFIFIIDSREKKIGSAFGFTMLTCYIAYFLFLLF